MRIGDRILITGAEETPVEPFSHAKIKIIAGTLLRQHGSSASAAISIFRSTYDRRFRSAEILFYERRAQAQQ